MTMHGKFKSRNGLLAAVICASFIFLPFIMRIFTPVSPGAVAWLSVFCLAGMIFALNIPYYYSADDNGVTMTSGSFRRYIAYDDIRSVDIKMLPHAHRSGINTEYRIEYVLTICTAHGVYRYRENCGKVFGNHFNDIGTVTSMDGSELKKLADIINARI